MKLKYLTIGAFALLVVLLLAGCATDGSTPCPTSEPCPEVDCPEAPECPECPECEECEACPEVIVEEVPAAEAWAASPHNDEEAEAFRHWDEDDPPVIPGSCAQCHSTTGYVHYVGGDGSEPFTMELESVPVGETIECIACHNSATVVMDSVPFPSGAIIEGLGAEARCMVCHQGRASKVQVDETIEANGLTEDVDTVSEELGFINIHYYAAAASLYGTATMGGYEYEGNSYDFKNDHVEGYDTCTGCHNSHTLELKIEECATCHTGVASVEDVRMIRMAGSLVDYNGNGDIEEGIADEIAGLHDLLYQAIQAYGLEVAGTPIIYDSLAYPYFFIDTNGNGDADEDEVNFGNQYNAWTARLLKAAYNFQTAAKDPGQYAHGGKYIIQLLYDSIEDLNEVISTPVDLSNANRIDAGHFAGSEEAFRHWDEDGAVPGSCARCHSAAGLPTYLAEGVNVSEPIANGFNCATCHDDLVTFTRYPVADATFPSGATASFGESNDSNICIQCHQGRESTSSLDAHIAASGAADDEVSESLSFRNPHYFAAGATLFGTEVAGAYEFDGQEYNGRNLHVPGFETCLGCHETHALEVKEESCATCHAGVENLTDIRITAGDFDGDGDSTEGIAGEIETVSDALFDAILVYAAENSEPIAYDSVAYPYWFTDLNGNGEADPDEANYGNRYVTWTPRLLRAAYNYTWVQKDPGAYAHNGLYMLQVLIDSLADIGGDASSMTRPEVKLVE
jgi:hypothetical protein